MGVTKVIKFYCLEPEPCLTANGASINDLNKATYSIFRSAFPQVDFYTMEFEKKNLFLDIKEYDAKKCLAHALLTKPFLPQVLFKSEIKIQKRQNCLLL